MAKGQTDNITLDTGQADWSGIGTNAPTRVEFTTPVIPMTRIRLRDRDEMLYDTIVETHLRKSESRIKIQEIKDQVIKKKRNQISCHVLC